MELLRRYNQNPQFAKSLVSKALTAATASGGPLTPQILERLITNTVVQLAPEIALISPKSVSGKYAEFNRLTALPTGHRRMGDGAVTPVSQSGYARTGRNLKVLRGKGAVTVFLQDASRDYIDVVAQENENHLMDHIHQFINLLLFGNENADQYGWTGLDSIVGSNGLGNRTNEAYGGSVPANLKFLDDMIDMNTRKQGARHRKVIEMSPEMLSLVSRLLTNVRLVQNLQGQGLGSIEIKGGWRLQTYRNIPIIESARMRPQATMPTVTFSTNTTGGHLSDGTWYAHVSFIDYNGESQPCAEVTCAVAGGGSTETIKLAWTKPTTGVFGEIMFYKIYFTAKGGSSHTEGLSLVLPAVLYDANGTPFDDVVSVEISTDPDPVTAITGLGNPTIIKMNDTAVGSAATLGGIVPTITTSVNSGMLADRPLVATANVQSEQVTLWDLDEIQGCGQFFYTNTEGSRFKGLVTLEPLAKTDDNLPFMVKTYGALKDAFEGTSYIKRGLRVA